MDYYPIPMLIGMRNTWSILSRAMRFVMPAISVRWKWRRRLAAFRPFRAVYGNIDGQAIRKLYPQVNRFTVDDTEVLIKHIGGYPGKYDPSIIGSLMTRPPKLFISGHSHILKVKYDKTLDMLHINPGAAGMSGFHKVRTLVRFVIERGTFKDLEVIELADK